MKRFFPFFFSLFSLVLLTGCHTVYRRVLLASLPEGTVYFIRSESNLLRRSASLCDFTQITALEFRRDAQDKPMLRFGIKNLTGGAVPEADLHVHIASAFYNTPCPPGDHTGLLPIWRAFPRSIHVSPQGTEYLDISCDVPGATGFIVELSEE